MLGGRGKEVTVTIAGRIGTVPPDGADVRNSAMIVVFKLSDHDCQWCNSDDDDDEHQDASEQLVNRFSPKACGDASSV
jgi:hypothetical protein